MDRAPGALPTHARAGLMWDPAAISHWGSPDRGPGEGWGMPWGRFNLIRPLAVNFFSRTNNLMAFSFIQKPGKTGIPKP